MTDKKEVKIEKFDTEKNLTLNLEVTKRDTVDIAVSNYEDKLHSLMDKATAHMEKVIRKKDKAFSKFKKKVAKFVKNHEAQEEVATMSKLLNKFGVNNNMELKENIKMSEDNMDLTVIGDVVISFKHSQYEGESFQDAFVKGDDYVFELNDELDGMREVIVNLHKELVETKIYRNKIDTDLMNLERVERKAKASLAKATLQGSEDGDRILQLLENMIAPESYKALPSFIADASHMIAEPATDNRTYSGKDPHGILGKRLKHTAWHSGYWVPTAYKGDNSYMGDRFGGVQQTESFVYAESDWEEVYE